MGLSSSLYIVHWFYSKPISGPTAHLRFELHRTPTAKMPLSVGNDLKEEDTYIYSRILLNVVDQTKCIYFFTGKHYEWQLSDGQQWLMINNDHIIECNYCQPGAKGITIDTDHG